MERWRGGEAERWRGGEVEEGGVGLRESGRWSPIIVVRDCSVTSTRPLWGEGGLLSLQFPLASHRRRTAIQNQFVFK